MLSSVYSEATRPTLLEFRGNISDSDFVRDIVILDKSMGMLHQRAITVLLPGKNDHRDKFVYRHDYTLTLHAAEFLNEMDLPHLQPITQRITQIATKKQQSMALELKQYSEDEVALASYRVLPSEAGSEISD